MSNAINLEKAVKGFEAYAKESDDWAKAQGLGQCIKNTNNTYIENILKEHDPKEYYVLHRFKYHKGDKASDKVARVLEKEFSKKRFLSYTLQCDSDMILDFPDYRSFDVIKPNVFNYNLNKDLISKYGMIKKIIVDCTGLDAGNPDKKEIVSLYDNNCGYTSTGMTAKIGYYPDGKAKVTDFAFDLVVRLGIGHKYVFPISASHPDVFVSATVYTDKAGAVVREDAFLFKERKDQRSKNGIIREYINFDYSDEDFDKASQRPIFKYMTNNWQMMLFEYMKAKKGTKEYTRQFFYGGLKNGFLTLSEIREMFMNEYKHLLFKEAAKKKANDKFNAYLRADRKAAEEFRKNSYDPFKQSLSKD
jgi:hypothetical protein